LNPRFSRQDARLVTISRLPRHSIGANGLLPRSGSAKRVSFYDPNRKSGLRSMRAGRPAAQRGILSRASEWSVPCRSAVTEYLDTAIQLVTGNIQRDVAYFRITAACALLAAPLHAQLRQRSLLSQVILLKSRTNKKDVHRPCLRVLPRKRPAGSEHLYANYRAFVYASNHRVHRGSKFGGTLIKGEMCRRPTWKGRRPRVKIVSAEANLI